MADIQIHQLSSLSRDPTTTDVLAIDSGSSTMKVGYGTLKSAILSDISNSVVADEYSTSTHYAVGDYCIRSGVLYRCTTAIPNGESWTSGHWTSVTLGADVAVLRSRITEAESDISDIESDISDIGSDVETLQSDVSGLSSDLSALSEQVAGISVTVSSNTLVITT